MKIWRKGKGRDRRVKGNGKFDEEAEQSAILRSSNLFFSKKVHRN